jgi:hypothetical protein
MDYGPAGKTAMTAPAWTALPGPRRPLVSMICPFSPLVNRLTRGERGCWIGSSCQPPTVQAALPCARSKPQLMQRAHLPPTLPSVIGGTPQLRSGPTSQIRMPDTYLPRFRLPTGRLVSACSHRGDAFHHGNYDTDEFAPRHGRVITAPCPANKNCCIRTTPERCTRWNG